MKQAAIAFAVGTPAQICVGIDSALGGLAEKIGRAERQDAAQNAPRRHFVDGQRRLAGPSPYFLVRIGKDRIPHLGETRASVGAIVVYDSLNPEKFRFHGSSPTRSRNFTVARRFESPSNEQPEVNLSR